MKKILMLILILEGVHVCTLSQEVRMTMEEWNNLQDSIEVKTDSIRDLKSQIELMDRNDVIIKNVRDSLSQTMDSLNLMKLQNRTLMEEISQLSVSNEEINSQLSSLSEKQDRYLCIIANSLLYGKYDEDAIEKSRADLEHVRNIFREKILNLIDIYGQTNADIKQILTEAQNDPRRGKYSDMDSFIDDYKNRIKSMDYFNQYYVNRNNENFWSIPYLNNMISAALHVLERHNPGTNNFADFSVIIELL